LHARSLAESAVRRARRDTPVMRGRQIPAMTSGSSPAARVRFPRDTGFHADLKRGAAAHFDRAGRPRSGGAAMHLKTATILAWFVASYALLLALGGTSGWVASALTVSVALATAGIGFSIMHDANHGAYGRTAAANRAWGLALDFIGASSHVWRFKHNTLHHTYANIDGMDADIDAGPFLRLAPTQPLRPFHRFQHLYAWPLYGILAIKWWFVDDLIDLARGRIGSVAFPRPTGRQLATVVAGKAVFVTWTLLVPWLVFRSAWIAPLFLLGSFVLGLVLSIVFQLAHAVPETELHAAFPGEQRMPTGWAEHQVRATADFAPRNRLLGWYVGGLNFQIEHHLFPEVCHQHYPALAGVVEAACLAHGIPYCSHRTLRDAVAAHFQYLYALGWNGLRCAASTGAAAPAGA
jgi:linoleoyl-CoA desaturase